MNMIKIGTRNSPLALWQSREVARHLQNSNCKTDIITIISEEENVGNTYDDEDKELFTRDLHHALQNNEIDVAVHSLKDLPQQLPENVEIIAYLKRDYAEDILIRNSSSQNIALKDLKVATNDFRRKAFWRKEFPFAEFENVTGNANTRLNAVEKQQVEATIISLARLKRLNLNYSYEQLPFILPAPAQGVTVVLGRSDNQQVNQFFSNMNHLETQYCAENERAFQKILNNHNKVAIGAFSEIKENQIRFRGMICSENGKNSMETDDIFPVDFQENYGKKMAEQLQKNGGNDLLYEE